MDIALTERHERYIRSKIESGAYGSPEEVVRDGLRLLEAEDERRRQISRLQQDVENGFAGTFTRWTKGDSDRVRKAITRRGRARR